MEVWYLKVATRKKDTTTRKGYSQYEYTIYFGGWPYDYAE